MPVYDYICEECGTHYDIFHKVKEIGEDIVCPECESPNHRKIMSVPGIAVKSAHSAPTESCGMGDDCCGGVCSMN